MSEGKEWKNKIFGFDYCEINMVQVSKEYILELQQIIKEDYGRKVSFSEASEIANGLVGYFDLLAKLYHQMNSEPANTQD